MYMLKHCLLIVTALALPHLYAMDTVAQKRIFTGHTDTVSCLTMFKTKYDNQLLMASGSWDKTVKLWNVKTGECFYTFDGHTDKVTVVADFSNDSPHPELYGVFIDSGSCDGTVRSSSEYTKSASDAFWHAKHTASVTHVLILRRDIDIVVSAFNDGVIQIAFITEGGTDLHTIQAHDTKISKLYENESNPLAFFSQDVNGCIKEFDLKTRQCISTKQSADRGNGFPIIKINDHSITYKNCCPDKNEKISFDPFASLVLKIIDSDDEVTHHVAGKQIQSLAAFDQTIAYTCVNDPNIYVMDNCFNYYWWKKPLKSWDFSPIKKT